MSREYKRRGDAYGRTTSHNPNPNRANSAFHISGGAIEIDFEVARTAVDFAGNITRVIKPYNVNNIISRVQNEYRQRVGKSINSTNIMQLTKILKLSEEFIGAHYHTLGEWAADNVSKVNRVLGLPYHDGPAPEWEYRCQGDCSKVGVGDCEGVCVGVLCETVPGVTYDGPELPPGTVTHASSKTYGINIRIAL